MKVHLYLTGGPATPMPTGPCGPGGPASPSEPYDQEKTRFCSFKQNEDTFDCNNKFNNELPSLYFMLPSPLQGQQVQSILWLQVTPAQNILIRPKSQYVC